MNKRDELQQRIGELEAKDDPSPEEKAELKQKQQELRKLEREPQHVALCPHKDARLEHRFCPTCGEAMPALPRAAIEQIIEEVLAKREQNPSDEGVENGEDDAESEEQLRKQYRIYDEAVKKLPWLKQHSRKFRTFGQFRDANLAERQAEFKRLGIAEPWSPRSSGQKKALAKAKR